ncbi:TetR/AcrR family transcriptional regulator [Streptomyces anthocyanicus]|uniref:TetR family transcriptional regulator n=1 Tax=Streptomyces violaceolatus TaxID=67378 RepID=A0ABN3SX54_9ACTN|nr:MULTISPECIES: TetR family transcriptional regulator [unclassified Streptomyces]WTC09398.1 TetR/AcrR family transcriptional regulator [Streptomyces anthocyanicus]MBQ0953900.1 TetR family transcriptional regulator [Streptomyces sp. RK76]MDX3321294.1 TetR family transcriptional regulator [Streptomyces sp. ME03-5684b]MDX3370396.1 TetR family transcriptional regulator [Streptomyces sp. ME02-6987-2C]MDX3424328.1 TetR family transcriptional regulator [Streptomyces sp. ME02-6985-2c]
MSSTIPALPGPEPGPGPEPAGPVSLTERRKAETRMEIARAAARLFVGQGLRATRAEDIARAAGVAPRTFYRYFATKEEAVAPLYALGAERWVRAVREAPAELSPPEALERAVRHTLTPGAGVSAPSWEWARTLIRLAESSPALRKVWAEVCHSTERGLVQALAARMSGGDDNVAVRLAASPRLHFAAAVAGASVRVAAEHWASSSPQGARSPLEQALLNLEVLRGFAWEAGPAEEG